MFHKIIDPSGSAPPWNPPTIIADKGEYYIKLSDVKDTIVKDIESHLDVVFSVLVDRFCTHIDKRLTKLSDQTANSFTYISKFIESHGDVFITDYSNADMSDISCSEDEDSGDDWLDSVGDLASDIRKRRPDTYPRVKSVYNAIIKDMWRDYGFVKEELRIKYSSQYDTDKIPCVLELIHDDPVWSKIFLNLLTDLHNEIIYS